MDFIRGNQQLVLCKTRYLFDSSDPNMLGFPGATDDASIGFRCDSNCLLKQATEQLGPRTRRTTIEAENQFVEIIGQMLPTDSTLMSSQQPALQHRRPQDMGATGVK